MIWFVTIISTSNFVRIRRFTKSLSCWYRCFSVCFVLLTRSAISAEYCTASSFSSGNERTGMPKSTKGTAKTRVRGRFVDA